ncbi:B-cell receptor-associated 31-like protein [Guyanagaster necrorhizus]|uniref:Endoplasmic reticulum transmembrane protein n=1 Tax=Guyanagaster necrorhizus TaxID=856835 RepID=A0A9P8APG9_9AGAR|nr:B-cell receptor-associated 31-like protein [Guyanagaster necrorhizus MCA 3950]KAG7443328.1 B-cell receptor-associated 31-like protein [Guyanagaster necrorhizus MCA 3950]
MTIYYSLTFFLLAAEMGTFCLIVLPLPHTVKKRVFSFLSTSPFVAKIAYALKISFIFVGILFFDALQRMFRVTAEAELAKSGQQGVSDVRTETNLAARKFYSQRNVYLTGFTLFLSLVLTRTFSIILDLIQAQDELLKHNGELDSSKELEKLRKKADESDTLKRDLEKAHRDLETLKSQALSQAAEYDRLSDDYNKASGSSPRSKSD